MPLQISDHVRAIGDQAQAALTEQFARIDEIADFNTQKVLSAFQKHRVADTYFQSTTGYGYDDLGREKLGEIYADIFGTEEGYVLPVQQLREKDDLTNAFKALYSRKDKIRKHLSDMMPGYIHGTNAAKEAIEAL